MSAGRKIIFMKSGVFLLLFLFFVSTAFAEGGDKSSSPGTPGQKTLSFISISLVDGGKVQDAADVPTQPKFKLEFDKNVVNSTIWENNRNCFSLISQNSENIPVSVTKVDDTIDFSQRNNIFVQPASILSPGTSYTLKISPALKAKNGVSTLGGTTSEGLNISFKTQGQAASQPVTQTAAQQPPWPDSQPAPPSEQKTVQINNENTQSQASADGGNDANNTASAGKANTGESPAQTGAGLNYTNLLTILTVVLLAGWIAVEVFIKKKKRG